MAQELPTSLERGFSENFALGRKAFGRKVDWGLNAHE